MSLYFRAGDWARTRCIIYHLAWQTALDAWLGSSSFESLLHPSPRGVERSWKRILYIFWGFKRTKDQDCTQEKKVGIQMAIGRKHGFYGMGRCSRNERVSGSFLDSCKHAQEFSTEERQTSIKEAFSRTYPGLLSVSSIPLSFLGHFWLVSYFFKTKQEISVHLHLIITGPHCGNREYPQLRCWRQCQI